MNNKKGGEKNEKGADSIWEARASKSLRITFNLKRGYNYPQNYRRA